MTLNFRRCDGAWCISSITYAPYGGLYTKKYTGSLILYVGKTTNGLYPDSCCTKGCYRICNEYSPGAQCHYSLDVRKNDRYWKPKELEQFVQATFVDEINSIFRNENAKKICNVTLCAGELCKIESKTSYFTSNF